MDVVVWLRSLGLEEYEALFRENKIDREVLRELTEADFEKLGVPLGHRKRLLKAIAALDAAPSAAAERRQLTVMFCDLVGSTPLSARLDLEDLRELIGAYHRCVAETVRRFDGFVAKYMGDGVLAYFCYPYAHEDDAERAVRAALAVVEAAGRLSTSDYTPQVRIGIATGQVVIGDLIGEGAAQEQGVVGETPNLAARLQAAADPNSVVIAPSTRRLTGGLFEYRKLGPVVLKGFAEPMIAWQVVGDSTAESRFEALRATSLTPLVGRQEELELLLARWRQALAGNGQVVPLMGEPGIGKSRTTRALNERLAGEPYTRLSYFCSPHHQDSALYPFIAQLGRAAGFGRGDAPEERLAKLEAVLTQSSHNPTEEVPLLAELLSIPTGDRYRPLALSPQRRKEKTLEALVAQLAGLAAQRPVLMVFEDAHWIDPTSREVLDLTVKRVPSLPVLLIITFRPEFTPAWTGSAHVTSLVLDRLNRPQVTALVAQVSGKPLPASVVEQIVAKSDGVPLFTEELTKAVVESEMVVDAGDRYELAEAVDSMRIPATLHDSLMARLDRLIPMKEVAQIGAAIGREFSYELLAAVSPMGDTELDAALERITSSGLVYQHGVAPHGTFVFKHALVQDAAYNSLLKRRRLELHWRIAEVLETRFPETAQTQPELVAHHYTAADRPDKAVPYWLRAGQRALQSLALKESVEHLSRGLGLLKLLPETAERDARELDLQATLGTAQMMWKGYANPATGAAYKRADVLLAKIGDSPQQFPVLWGVWAYYLVQPDYPQTYEAAKRALAVAERSRDPGLLVQALSLNCVTMFWVGHFREARAFTERVVEIYDEERDGPQVWTYNHDAKNLCQIYAAQYLWILGYPDQAARVDIERAAQARRLKHLFLTAFGDMWGGTVWIYRHDTVRHARILSDLVTTSREQGFPMWEAGAYIYQGWWLVQNGEFARGAALIDQGYQGWLATGAGNVGPYQRAMLADAYSLAGDEARARKLIDEALARVESVDERCHEAEVHRIKGDVLLRGIAPDEKAAQSCYRESLRVAHSQQAKGWELRTSTSLARLWHNQGKKKQALELLAPIYDWFTEGLDTRDLKEAKALLDQLTF